MRALVLEEVMHVSGGDYGQGGAYGGGGLQGGYGSGGGVNAGGGPGSGGYGTFGGGACGLAKAVANEFSNNLAMQAIDLTVKSNPTNVIGAAAVAYACRGNGNGA